MPVSIFGTSSGAATAVRTVNGCIRASRQLPDIGEPAEYRGGRDHRRAHDVGQGTAALTAFKIAVGGRGAAFARRDQFAVRAIAHGAAGIAPLKTGIEENTIETFGLGLPLHRIRAR